MSVGFQPFGLQGFWLLGFQAFRSLGSFWGPFGRLAFYNFRSFLRQAPHAFGLSLASSAPPLSVSDSAIAPSARM